MRPIDFIIIAIVLVAVYFAIRHVKKNKGTCDCGCSCGCRECHEHDMGVKKH